MEVTIDRISSVGNPLAKKRHNGIVIRVPDGEVGETYEVVIESVRGTYAVARVVPEGTAPSEESTEIDPEKVIEKKNDTSKNDLLNGKL